MPMCEFSVSLLVDPIKKQKKQKTKTGKHSFQFFDLERTWGSLFQKRVVRTHLDIYVFVNDIKILRWSLLFTMFFSPMLMFLLCLCLISYVCIYVIITVCSCCTLCLSLVNKILNLVNAVYVDQSTYKM